MTLAPDGVVRATRAMALASLIGQALLLIDVNDVNPSLWALVQAMRVVLIYPLLLLAIRFLGVGLSLALSAMALLASTMVLLGFSMRGGHLPGKA